MLHGVKKRTGRVELAKLAFIRLGRDSVGIAFVLFQIGERVNSQWIISVSRS
jgi:hypothetical protein